MMCGGCWRQTPFLTSRRGPWRNGFCASRRWRTLFPSAAALPPAPTPSPGSWKPRSVLFSLLLSFNNVLDDNVLLLYALFPLILLPYGLLLRQTFLSEMLELESACKYNISRTLAMRFFVLGCTAILAVTTAFLPLSLLRFAGILPVGYNLPDVLAALANFTVTAALILFCGLRRIRWGLLAGAALFSPPPLTNALRRNPQPAGFLACLLAASLLLFVAAVLCRARLRVRLDNTFYRGGM